MGVLVSAVHLVCARAQLTFVGQHIARLCNALGMIISISDRKGAAAVERQDMSAIRGGRSCKPEGLQRSSFADILTQSTVLFICVPRTTATLNMVASMELARMASNAIVVNVSRGGIVNETDLLQALKGRQIAGAATDVFIKEPACASNSVLIEALAQEQARDQAASSIPLVVTPHTAWYSQSTMSNLTESVKENLEGWWRNACPQENIVL
jgi:lactate dehydrogenase-like 2-hydroxyacid dehydrogenase